MDWYNTAFVQRGIDTSTFARNPVIGWSHFKDPVRGAAPIGVALEWGVEKFKGREALIGLAQFHDDQFSNARFEDYAANPPRLRAWSINGIPVSAGPPTHEEIRANPDWAECEQVFRSIRLLEVSACTIPGNEHTLTLSVERGYQGSRPGPRMPRFEDLDPDQRQRYFELWPDISRRMLARVFPTPRERELAAHTRAVEAYRAAVSRKIVGGSCL